MNQEKKPIDHDFYNRVVIGILACSLFILTLCMALPHYHPREQKFIEIEKFDSLKLKYEIERDLRIRLQFENRAIANKYRN